VFEELTRSMSIKKQNFNTFNTKLIVVSMMIEMKSENDKCKGILISGIESSYYTILQFIDV
jgi:hypothetical protein